MGAKERFRNRAMGSDVDARERRGGPRRGGAGGVMCDFDRSAAVLLAKVGTYPMHHGTVGAIRSLGRVGVPVYAVVEGRLTPAACSRYLEGRFRWRTTGQEEPGELLARLMEIGRSVPQPVILVATDER